MTRRDPLVRFPWIGVVILLAAALLISKYRHILVCWLLITLVFGGYLLYLGVTFKPAKVASVLATKRFSFLAELRWSRELSLLKIQKSSLEAPAIPESFLISEALDQLFSLVIQEFVESWYKSISSNTLFQDSIRLELKGLVTNLKERLAKVNLANLLVFKIFPIITDHYARFVSIDNSHDSTYSIESKLSTANRFGKSKLHLGVSLSLPGPNARNKEKVYLRRKVGSILPVLLSPLESSNDTVLLLLRELLACTILANVVEVLGEGDFFNQMIVKLIGTNLQHRDQVKRLRAALQEHTALGIPRDFSSKLAGPLTPSKVAHWINYIDTCESRNELEAIQKVVEKKRSLVPRNSSDNENEKIQLGVLADKLSWKLRSYKSNVTLESILNLAKLAEIFREYLKKDKHESDIDLWQAIERIKAPLETSNDEQIPLLLEFSSEDDILRIYSKFFNASTIPISNDIREKVTTYVKSSNTDNLKPVHYQQARSALFLLQDHIVEHMKNHHLKGFQRSNRYGDLELVNVDRRLRREASLAFGVTTVQNALPDTIKESDNLSPGVVEAVENAFEKIMNSSRDERDSSSLFNVKIPSRVDSKSDLTEKLDLFGNTSTLFGDELKGDGFPQNSNRVSALFENDSESDSDSDSANSDSLLLSAELTGDKMTNLEILLAAPGDLNLAEQIGTLNNDIESLTEQDAILASLLRKAELTNNIPELRVLQKSKISVEREISAKELQKQQYIVQENENSLYGKSKVQIQSCVFGNDDSATSYVLYIIEVQKFASDDPTDAVAGWVVARRFSQFFKLNEYLKRRCPEVANIKFPKKTVPMLKFQKVQQIEMRKPMLEQYLQSLLKIPEVCSDPAFRSFLSSEDFRIGHHAKNSQKKFDAFFNSLYGKVSQRVPLNNTIQARSDKEQEDILANIQEMERELKQFDEIGKDNTKIPFVKPISDLLMTVFNLRNSQSWLRGRALLVILQQVLGSAIEKTITQQVDTSLRQEEKLLDILGLLREMLFPNGKFRESPQLRTKSEQSSTRQEANVILRIFMNETCAKIFGFKNTNQASTQLFELFQNDFLNKHLIFEILDEIIAAVCPEAEDTV